MHARKHAFVFVLARAARLKFFHQVCMISNPTAVVLLCESTVVACSLMRAALGVMCGALFGALFGALSGFGRVDHSDATTRYLLQLHPARPCSTHLQGKGRRVVAFSLYGGDEPRYTDGAIANAHIVAAVYPGWEMWVYHDDFVPSPVLETLGAHTHVSLIRLNRSLVQIENAMAWRFLVASDPTVDRFIVRDVDSRLSPRERLAVDEWVASGLPFHVMRDHPGHLKYPISGGMWGGTRDAVPNMAAKILHRQWWMSGAMENAYLGDMQWLQQEIWPIAKQKGVWQSDSFSCHGRWGEGHPFPTPRVGSEIVGSVFVGGSPRRSDEIRLEDTPVVVECVVAQPSVDIAIKFDSMTAEVAAATVTGQADIQTVANIMARASEMHVK